MAACKRLAKTILKDTSYAVALSNAALPAAARYFFFFCAPFFARKAAHRNGKRTALPKAKDADCVSPVIYRPMERM